MVDASLAHNHYDVLGQCVAVSEHASVTGPLMRRCGGVWSFRCRSGLFHSLYVCVWLCMCVCLSVCGFLTDVLFTRTRNVRTGRGRVKDSSEHETYSRHYPSLSLSFSQTQTYTFSPSHPPNTHKDSQNDHMTKVTS